uniref:Uncharacterized protein n=1 Tax=Cyprinus carpio TaxID=7962 RepID=A0A8C1SEW3_CYPCA
MRLTRFSQQNIFVAYTEEHVRVTRMLHITRKGIPHDAMPGALILSVKFLKEKKEKCSNATCILVHIHSQKSTLQCLTLHLP